MSTVAKKPINLERFRWTDEEWQEVFDAAMERVRPKSVAGSTVNLVCALETLEAAQTLKSQEGRIVGLSTGYSSLDKMTKGMTGGDLIIVYGSTSHGKSQLAQNITYRLAARQKPVLFIGLEMTNAQNTGRFMSIGTDDVETALAHILYPESNDLSWANIEDHVAKGVADGAQLVVIDQLQQLTRDPNNVTNETSQVTHEVKRMAIKYNVPIMLLSHINRSGLDDSPPTLRELKGSSSIEQDADICLAVWRDMDPQHDQMHLLEVWLRKNRNRGMEHLSTTLTVQDGVKLVDALAGIA